MFSLFGGSPVVRRKATRRKATKRKATKRKATRRKSVRRKATRRKAQKKRVAKGRKRFVYGGSPTEQELNDQEEKLIEKMYYLKYYDPYATLGQVEYIQSELRKIREMREMMKGGSPFRNPGDPKKEFQGFAENTQVRMVDPGGEFTKSEGLTRTKDGAPPTILQLTTNIILKFVEGGGIPSIDHLQPLLGGDFSQIPIESVILMLESYVTTLRSGANVGILNGRVSIGLEPTHIDILERLIGVLTQLQPQVEAAKAAKAAEAAEAAKAAEAATEAALLSRLQSLHKTQTSEFRGRSPTGVEDTTAVTIATPTAVLPVEDDEDEGGF
mgnify:CR=1 FL=1|tara:strand:+ start:1219 stop:2199 length:981 start_codon:yes stop_codon:yes gene_type:complete